MLNLVLALLAGLVTRFTMPSDQMVEVTERNLQEVTDRDTLKVNRYPA